MTHGRLIYVAGPSGAGKDSVLKAARHVLGECGVFFAHRYITRPADAGGENHIALSEAEFERRRRAGCFALHWCSHGLRYGIGREIDLWMRSGVAVVVNGSRAYLPEAMSCYPGLVPVLITAPPDVLRERLLARGRESAADVERRLRREVRDVLPSATGACIMNDGELSDAVNAFCAILQPTGLIAQDMNIRGLSLI